MEGHLKPLDKEARFPARPPPLLPPLPSLVILVNSSSSALSLSSASFFSPCLVGSPQIPLQIRTQYFSLFFPFFSGSSTFFFISNTSLPRAFSHLIFVLTCLRCFVSLLLSLFIFFSLSLRYASVSHCSPFVALFIPFSHIITNFHLPHLISLSSLMPPSPFSSFCFSFHPVKLPFFACSPSHLKTMSLLSYSVLTSVFHLP